MDRARDCHGPGRRSARGTQRGLPAAAIALDARAAIAEGQDRAVEVTLANTGTVPALNAKLTLVDAAGKRILPAYYSDNYVALLPGERRTVTIRYPASVSAAPAVTLLGLNVPGRAAAAQ